MINTFAHESKFKPACKNNADTIAKFPGYVGNKLE